MRPSRVEGDLTFASISAGGRSTCGVTADEEVYCWDNTSYGMPGIQYRRDKANPLKVYFSKPFVAISTGNYHTCGIVKDGDAYCWGYDTGGLLGIGPTPDTYGYSSRRSTSRPRKVFGGTDLVNISASENHTCGTSTEGEIYCWGEGRYGQLGTGRAQHQTLSPVRIDSTDGYITVDAGGNHTCGLTAELTAYCWGLAGDGQLGYIYPYSGRPPGQWDSPIQVSGGLLFNQISAGGYHTCGISSDGDVYCWGSNSMGQVASSTDKSVLLPQLVEYTNQP